LKIQTNGHRFNFVNLVNGHYAIYFSKGILVNHDRVDLQIDQIPSREGYGFAHPWRLTQSLQDIFLFLLNSIDQT
jgi:hypothetical protein